MEIHMTILWNLFQVKDKDTIVDVEHLNAGCVVTYIFQNYETRTKD